MAFTAPLPEWQKEGSTPLPSYIQNGWGIGEFPPADWFNWQWHLTYEALKELQEKALYSGGGTPTFDSANVNGRLHVKNAAGKDLSIQDYGDLSSNSGGSFLIANNAYIVDGSKYYHSVGHPSMGARGLRLSTSGVEMFDTGSKVTANGEEFTPVFRKVATLDSPAFTGAPTAPTATEGDNTTKLATTAFVTAAVAAGGGGGDMGKFVFNENGVSWIDEGTPIMIIDETLLPYSSRGKKGLWATDMVAETFESTIDSGAPFFIKSTAVVENLNADMLDGKHAYDFMVMDDGLSRQGGDFSFWNPTYEEQVFIASTQLVQNNKPGIFAPNVVGVEFAAFKEGAASPYFKVSKSLDEMMQQSGLWAENIAAEYLDVMGSANFKGGVNLGKETYFSEKFGAAPFTVDSDIKVTKLNADRVDNYHVEYYAQPSTIPVRDGNSDMNTRVYKSSATTGTAPLQVASTTMVANLNADMVDGLHANVFLKNKAAAPDANGGNIYVNPTTGNDTTGNGTSGAPYKTITKALTTVEDGIYPDGATIYLSPGTYNENVNPRGGVFNNQGLVIYGDFSSPGSYIINGYVEVRRVDNFRIAGVTVRDQISFYRCKWGCIETVISTGVDAVRMFAYWADGSAGYIRDSTISNKWLAISANTMSRVFSYNNTGTGNGNGLGAEMGAKVTYNGTVPSATTATRISTGGAVSTAS